MSDAARVATGCRTRRSSIVGAFGPEFVQDAAGWPAPVGRSLAASRRIGPLGLLDLIGNLDRGGLVGGNSGAILRHGRLPVGRPRSISRLWTGLNGHPDGGPCKVPSRSPDGTRPSAPRGRRCGRRPGVLAGIERRPSPSPGRSAGPGSRAEGDQGGPGRHDRDVPHQAGTRARFLRARSGRQQFCPAETGARLGFRRTDTRHCRRLRWRERS